MKIIFSLLFFTLLLGSPNFLNNYKIKNCNYEKFDSKAYKSLLSSIKDSIALVDYNNFIGDKKIQYLEGGIRKVNNAIGRVSITPVNVENWNVIPPQKKQVYNIIKPVCIQNKEKYYNIYNLHFSFSSAKIELIVVDNRLNIISGLVLFEGEMNYDKQEVTFQEITTTVKGNIFNQVIKSESPENESFKMTYKQNDNGMIEQL